MAPPHTPLPPAADPIRKTFDPWNSSATGHQRAENRGVAGSTAWRQSRTLKLAHQYEAGVSGGKIVSDTIGEGSRWKDGRCENGDWAPEALGLREKGWQDVQTLSSFSEPRGNRKMRENSRGEQGQTNRLPSKPYPVPSSTVEAEAEEGALQDQKSGQQKKKIFQNLCIYINGSTAPMVSDLHVKRLLAEHGAGISISLGRRSVTHVILGKPNDAGHQGAGGGLAAGKLQKEIKRVGGCGVKYVGVEWVLESIKAGKRLPEAQFCNLSTAAKGQQSVYGLFRKNPAPEGLRKSDIYNSNKLTSLEGEKGFEKLIDNANS